MDILGIDISKARFDAALLTGERARHAAFSSTEAGFGQLLTWLAKHRPDPAAPVHACMEATGNWGLDLAAFLHGRGVRISLVNPVWPAFGRTQPASRLSVTASSPATRPTGSTPPSLPASAALRSHPRGCCLLHTCASFASWSAAATCSKQPASRNSTVRSPASPRTPSQPPSLPTPPGSMRRSRPSWTRCAASSLPIPPWARTSHSCAASPVSATILLAELPNIADFTPKGLATFAGLSPSRSDPSPKEPAAKRPEGEHSSGSSVRRPGRISRVGNERLRSTLYMCVLSAKRTNKALTAFVQRMTAAGKPPKVILVAVARKLLVYAHAVVRTQKPFDPLPDVPENA